ncbi:MAG: 30S ribosomal protein S16 [Elusimicrobiales bacterium]
MAVALRLQRTGKPKEPHYRVVAIARTRAVRGKPLEVVGHYHPALGKENAQLSLKLDRVEHWIKTGAKPTETVASLIRRAKRAAAPKA